MRINSLVHQDGRAVLTLEGRFDFNSHRDFRDACDELLIRPGLKGIDVDFTRVDYLDSSALGMLLLLREKADTQGKQVALAGLQGTVKEVLDIANFDKLFTIR